MTCATPRRSTIIQALQDNGAIVRAFDPEGMKPAAKMLDNVQFGVDAYDVATGAHATVIVTEWNQFRSLDLHHLRSIMADPVLVDLRNIYKPADAAAHGLVYSSIGRPEGSVGGHLAEAAE